MKEEPQPQKAQGPDLAELYMHLGMVDYRIEHLLKEQESLYQQRSGLFQAIANKTEEIEKNRGIDLDSK